MTVLAGLMYYVQRFSWRMVLRCRDSELERAQHDPAGMV